MAGKRINPFFSFNYFNQNSGGGGGGAVTSVNGAIGDVTVDLDRVLAQGTTQPDGNYTLNFLGGAATLVPIQGETVGSYKAFSTTTIPSNYLWCNGATVLIATYPDLFAVIGNTYGGDGITTFAVPNMLDRLPKGDNGTNIGTIGGDNTLTESQLPIVKASGTISVSQNDGNVNPLNGDFFANPVDFVGSSDINGFILNGNQIPTVEIQGVIVSFGGGLPHEHPYLAVCWAICFESVGISGASPTPSFDQTLAVNNDSSIRASFNGIPYELSQIQTANESIITSTTPYVATDNIQTIYINPAANLATANITLPPNTTNGQKVVIACGGAITSGSVVSVLTVQGTVGKDILSGDSGNPTILLTQTNAGDVFTFQYSTQLSKWIIL